MSISIDVYRSRIGKFVVPRQKNVKLLTSLDHSKISVPKSSKASYKLKLIIALLCILAFTWTTEIKPTRKSLNVTKTKFYQFSYYIPYDVDHNFNARYKYGNRQNGMKLLHWNKGPSLLENKIEELETIINNYHPHILGLSEANLHKKNDVSNVKIPDYNIYTCLSFENPYLEISRVVVYVHKSIVVKPRPDLMSDQFSSIWLEAGLPNQRKVLICNAYREWGLLNQSSNNSKSIESQFRRWEVFINQWEQALNEGKEVICMGDMNIDHLRWNSNSVDPFSIRLRPLIDILFERILPQGVVQCVTTATRSWPGHEDSGLDHVYTNNPTKLSQVLAVNQGGSDHKMLFVSRLSKPIRRSVRYIKKRVFKDFNVHSFREEVSKIKWWSVYSCDCVDTAVSRLCSNLNMILDKLAPLKKIQVHSNYAPWLSKECKDLIKKRDQAQKLAAVSQKYVDWTIYKQLRNSVNNKLKADKKIWMTSQFDEKINSSSNIWRSVKIWLQWKTTGPPTQLFHNGQLINSPSGIANSMNKFFLDKVSKLRSGLPISKGNANNVLKRMMAGKVCSHKLKPVHPDIVLRVIKDLGNSKSTGMDEIDARSIKSVAEYLVPPITHILNLSISQSHFPTAWKTAKIVPLLKKGNSLEPKNYRPVALLPVLSKILEKVVFLQVVDYLNENNIYHPNHHGFRSHHSTATAIIQMYDVWTRGLDNKEMAGAMMINFQQPLTWLILYC